jgi:hypothetical protein
MVRSTAISWTIGFAVTASALHLWPLPALADDKLVQEVETRSLPLQPKAVPVTLLPPASDTVISSWRPWQMDGATIIMVRPAENVTIAPPRPEEVEVAPEVTGPAENAAVAQPRQDRLDAVPSITRPAENAAIAQPRQDQVEAAPIIARPAENAAIVQPRPQPEKVREDITRLETPSSKQRPRAALLPPASNAIIALPRPEPAKPQNSAVVAAIPSLPGRSPFRPAPFKSEIVENGPRAAFQQQAAEQPKGNAASRFLANLWPGNKASTPVSSTAGGGNAGSPEPSASNSEQGQSEAGQKSDKPPIKRFLDGIQFWKN